MKRKRKGREEGIHKGRDNEGYEGVRGRGSPHFPLEEGIVEQ